MGNKERPTASDATEAQHILETAILKFSDDARAPWERGTPNPLPLWSPRKSTLKYSPIRGGGFAWLMNADNAQTVAYYVAAAGKEPFSVVTAHGQARHNFDERLRREHIYPTASPWIEWYDWNTRRNLDDTER